MELTVEPIPCLSDNYAYLLADRAAGFCAVVDPSEAGPVLAALEASGRRLTHILNTHHHPDHTGGNAGLKQATGALVVGPGKDRERIPAIDIGVNEGESLQLAGRAIRILDVPAHTRGAIAFVIADAVFTGDTMFAMGCGRLFEGTPAMMVESLAKLAALPDATKVYCGHEYTLKNARFALTLEPGNAALLARLSEVTAQRDAGKPTVPSSIGLEKATSPFLRTHSAEIRATLDMHDAADVEVFAAIRRLRDAF
jgi:hydroxyacylglutathione hydrolase